MPRWATLTICLVIGTLFAWLVPLDRLFDAFQSVLTSLSIIAAALMVRLNRTMPTIDWKVLPQESRKQLTKKVVELTEEYLGTLASVVALTAFVLFLIVVGREHIFGSATGKPNPEIAWYSVWRRLDSGIFGAAVAFVCARMGYVVWRDLDIVRLQKEVIDLAGDQAHQAEQEKLAAEKVEGMERAGLRAIPNSPPKSWNG